MYFNNLNNKLKVGVGKFHFQGKLWKQIVLSVFGSEPTTTSLSAVHCTDELYRLPVPSEKSW